jgi:3-dehydroquinate dehydratase-2
MNILVINGPNLNLLGLREPNIYGNESYANLEIFINKIAQEKQFFVKVFQSNHEGQIIDEIHNAYFRKFSGIIINPGAFTHYSYAIYDAIKAVEIPTVEVHLSDINHREEFRKNSVTSKACIKQFYGKGFQSYREGIEFLIGELNATSQNN